MTQDSWKEVKSKVEGLGLKLKLHLEQENDETDATTKPGDTRAAVEELGDKIQEAFASFGNAAKDPAVRSDVKEIGLLLKNAMVGTFSEVGAEVGESLKKAGDRVGKSGAKGDEAKGDEATDDGDEGGEATGHTEGDAPESAGG